MYKFKHQLCFEQELLPFLGGNIKAICVDFWQIYAVIQEFYATAGRSGRAKYQLWWWWWWWCDDGDGDGEEGDHDDKGKQEYDGE